MKLQLKKQLADLKEVDCGFLAEARQAASRLKVGATRFVDASDFMSEKGYKAAMARKGQIMYHFHLCCESNQVFRDMLPRLEQQLHERGLWLDRFGISIDEAMALPKEIREQNRRGGALYFSEQAHWDELGMSAMMQPHLGDNMIGSPASFELVQSALRAGVTTIGNLSQFFGYEYPEYADVDDRTKSTLMAMTVMAEKKKDGALLHSNLDDGYGSAGRDLGLLLGCALLEQYVAEELMGVSLAHSYGDMFFSPEKRLVFLSALNMIHKDGDTGSMVFANKLGRNSGDTSLNVPHLSMSLIVDMAGQYVYRTGHAVTAMAGQGLTTSVTVEEIVKSLEYARELEDYLPHLVETIDFVKIDRKAESVVKAGRLFLEAVLDALSEHIDVTNPCAMLTALKRVGMTSLAEALGRTDQNSITADYHLFAHDH